MAHLCAHVLVPLPPLRGGVWCLGGFPGFTPVSGPVPLRGTFSGAGTYIAQNAYGAPGSGLVVPVWTIRERA
jgi:hypothetical protein